MVRLACGTLAAALWLCLAFECRADDAATSSASDDAHAAQIAALETRIAALEARLAEQDTGAAPADADAEPACETAGCRPIEPDDTPPINVSYYGDVYLQTRLQRTGLTTGESESLSDVNVYYGELGVDAAYGDWTGHFSMILDDASEDVLLHGAYARWQNTDDCATSPWHFELGRMVVPFGNNPSYFPTYSAANDLGYSTLHALGGGYESPNRAFDAHVYNSRAELADGDDTLSEYTATWDLATRTASDCQDGYQLTAGFISNLASHDLRLAGDELTSRVSGANVYGRYDFSTDGGMLHLLADYTWTLDAYAVTDLDGDADGAGDSPAALNTELVFEPEADTLYGVSYQRTDEFLDYAEQRWGLLYGERLNKLAMLKFEYTHGEYGNFVSGGQSSDDTFVAEVNLSF
jgi:hypothetical protein